MNVYDFDGTIFSSDCSIGFAIWCMNRHPKLWFTFFPFAIKNLILTQKGKMPDYLMRRKFFRYLIPPFLTSSWRTTKRGNGAIMKAPGPRSRATMRKASAPSPCGMILPQSTEMAWKRMQTPRYSDSHLEYTI
ncbi:MAG: hypothetical protein IKH30_07065 [Clostridia bacterium]|nr:hypothetical protein [Clostridia bacterium]